MGRPGRDYLAKSVEYKVEIYQNLPFGDLGDVVHSLAGIIPDTGILVGEAGKYWWDDNLKISGKLLPEGGKRR